MLIPLSRVVAGRAAHAHLELVLPAGFEVDGADLLGFADPEERATGRTPWLSTTALPSIDRAASATELMPNCHEPLTSGVSVVRRRAEKPGGGPARPGSMGSAIHIIRLDASVVDTSGVGRRAVGGVEVAEEVDGQWRDDGRIQCRQSLVREATDRMGDVDAVRAAAAPTARRGDC